MGWQDISIFIPSRNNIKASINISELCFPSLILWISFSYNHFKNYSAINSLEFERTWWILFQKRVLCTKLDMFRVLTWVDRILVFLFRVETTLKLQLILSILIYLTVQIRWYTLQKGDNVRLRMQAKSNIISFIHSNLIYEWNWWIWHVEDGTATGGT
jgi:hypothetical protein